MQYPHGTILNSNSDSTHKKLPENIYFFGVPNILPEPDPGRLCTTYKQNEIIYCLYYIKLNHEKNNVSCHPTYPLGLGQDNLGQEQDSKVVKELVKLKGSPPPLSDISYYMVVKRCIIYNNLSKKSPLVFGKYYIIPQIIHT